VVTTTGALGPSRSPVPLLGRLSLMMFLQYFVQGCYLPIASLYVAQTLGFTPRQVGIFVAALAVGPVLAPFLIGQVVDRAFATERVMAFCHFVGGALMLALFFQTQPVPVIVIGTVYSVLYVPTMMLSNSLAFHHLKDSDMEFPWIRLFGTLGYIVPAYLIEFWWLYGLKGDELNQARGIVFVFSGVVGLIMAAYCLTLPHTPAQKREDRRYAPGAVIAMLREQAFLVLVVVSFFIAMVHQFVIVWYGPFMRTILDTGGWGAYEQTISSLGQICEIGVLAILGFMIKRFGFKATLLLGATAYLLRCVLFSLVFSIDPPFLGKLILGAIGQGLHGFCFGCFLAAAYMYVDRIAPKDIKGSMQTLYGVFVIGLGFFVGGLVGGEVGDWFSTEINGETHYDWTSIWLVCTIFCAVCVLAFAAFFPKELPSRDFQTAEEKA